MPGIGCPRLTSGIRGRLEVQTGLGLIILQEATPFPPQLPAGHLQTRQYIPELPLLALLTSPMRED